MLKVLRKNHELSFIIREFFLVYVETDAIATVEICKC